MKISIAAILACIATILTQLLSMNMGWVDAQGITSILALSISGFLIGINTARYILLLCLLTCAIASQAQIEVGQVWRSKNGIECKVEQRIELWGGTKLNYDQIHFWAADDDLTNNFVKTFQPEPMIKVGDYWQDGSGEWNKVLAHHGTKPKTLFSTSTWPGGWWFPDSDFTNAWKRINWLTSSLVATNQPIWFLVGNSATNGPGIYCSNTITVSKPIFQSDCNTLEFHDGKAVEFTNEYYHNKIMIKVQFKNPSNNDYPTNVILYPPFSGTIQVGTNFYRINDKTRTYTEKVLEKVEN